MNMQCYVIKNTLLRTVFVRLVFYICLYFIVGVEISFTERGRENK